MKELIDRQVMATPATLIDGSLVVGFDKSKIDRLLEQ